MPAKGTVAVVLTRNLARDVAIWLANWVPPEPTLLGGATNPITLVHLNLLAGKLEKFSRRKTKMLGRRYFNVTREIAETFVRLRHPCAIGGGRAWPRATLKTRARFEGALRRLDRVGRPAIALNRLRQIVAGELDYADDRNLRRLRKRLREAERDVEVSARIDAWMACNDALGGSLLDMRVPFPKAP